MGGRLGGWEEAVEGGVGGRRWREALEGGVGGGNLP